MGRPGAHRGAPARTGLRLARGGHPRDERVAATLVPGGRGMVKPYLSRLRPAEHVPRLRQRARSRFEPARAFPVDGPPTGSLGLSLAPAVDAETADMEIELDEDPWSQLPAGQALP